MADTNFGKQVLKVSERVNNLFSARSGSDLKCGKIYYCSIERYLFLVAPFAQFLAR